MEETLVEEVPDIRKALYESGETFCREVCGALGVKGSRSLNLLVRTYYEMKDEEMRIMGRLGVKKDDEFRKNARELDEMGIVLLKSKLEQLQRNLHTFELEIGRVVRKQPVWHAFFKDVLGCGEMLAAVCITEFDIQKATTPSKMHAYAGMNPGLVFGYKTGKDKNGERVWEKSDDVIRGDKKASGFRIPFNSFLRAKLCGVLGDCLLKAGLRWKDCSDEEFDRALESTRRIKEETVKQVCEIKSKYARIYLDRKWRQEHSRNLVDHVAIKGGEMRRVPWCEVSPAHRHRDAIRIMVKEFLTDLYVSWRTVEGLEVRPPYHEEKLGHTHGK